MKNTRNCNVAYTFSHATFNTKFVKIAQPIEAQQRSK